MSNKAASQEEWNEFMQVASEIQQMGKKWYDKKPIIENPIVIASGAYQANERYLLKELQTASVIEQKNRQLAKDISENQLGTWEETIWEMNEMNEGLKSYYSEMLNSKIK